MGKILRQVIRAAESTSRDIDSEKQLFMCKFNSTTRNHWPNQAGTKDVEDVETARP